MSLLLGMMFVSSRFGAWLGAGVLYFTKADTAFTPKVVMFF